MGLERKAREVANGHLFTLLWLGVGALALIVTLLIAVLSRF